MGDDLMKKHKKIKSNNLKFNDICKDKSGNENIFCKIGLIRRVGY